MERWRSVSQLGGHTRREGLYGEVEVGESVV